jgi:hypothetical protein
MIAMRQNIVFIIFLILGLISCEKDETYPEIKLRLQGESLKLVEGANDELELNVELSNTYNSNIVCYIDYGDYNGELAQSIFSDTTENLTLLNFNGKYHFAKMINVNSGEREKSIKLRCKDNNWYRGGEDIKLRLLTSNNKILVHDSIEVEFVENEPKPIIGFLYNWDGDTVMVKNKLTGGGIPMTFASNIGMQFKPKVYLSFSGSAIRETHYSAPDFIILENSISYSFSDNPYVFTIIASANYHPEKTIIVTIDSIQNGIVADYKINSQNFGNFYKVRIRE